MHALSIRNLRKTYSNGFEALKGIDFDVESGDFYALLGPNGAGKSTLLRVCAGLQRIESGRAVVLDHDLVGDRAAVRRSVGLLGHDTALYDDLSVEENLRFWARASRVDVGAVDGALDRLGVADRLRDVPVRHLSAGQRRRTALAAVVVRRPRLWLLDEPLPRNANGKFLKRELRDTLDPANAV